jgi:uncharacterized repeat protein (TIGR03803 family)
MAAIVLAFCVAASNNSAAQTLTTLVNFDGSDGSSLYSSVIQAGDGNFYGTTLSGGAHGFGTVFKVTPAGALTTLYSFDGTHGNGPHAGLVQGRDGNFYGTTYFGGTHSQGTVFQITAAGVLTTLHSFCSQTNCTDGATPYAGLVQGADGGFYGTTFYGATAGTVFKITSAGVLTTLYSFGRTDGASPYAGLVQAADGNFYGTTTFGGTNFNCSGNNACGTVFRMTPGGVLTSLYSFCPQPGCADGANPYAALVQASDGNLYGTTASGGGNQNCGSGGTPGCGTIFRITPDGTVTTIYSFCSAANCPDGRTPWAGLVPASDGNLYGSTYLGGGGSHCANGCGSIFRTTLSGALTTLYDFDLTDGAAPYATLVQGIDRSLYGTASYGGVHNQGTLFELGAGIAPNAVQFVAVTPCRLVDTRPPGGSGPIPAGTSESFPIPQLGGCNIPATAAAYSLNVSVVPQRSLGYLTIWPTGERQPVVATLNSLDGRIKADAAIVPSGASGAVSIYVTDTTNVILDINGYFAPVSGSTLAFYPLPPCRVADTRYSTYPQGLGSPYLSGLHERVFPILNAASCNIPSSAAAYSLNFSVVPHGPLGYMTVWPTGQTRPLVSTLNDIPAQIIANAALVPAGTTGQVSVYPSSDTDLIIDINGYFAPAGTGGLSLYAVAPCRVIDTRQLGPPFSGTLSPPINVTGSPCQPPATAQAYVFNATVVPQGGLGYLTLWPDGSSRPTVSTLNALDGSITNNMAIVPTTNGEVDAYASGITQLILDISSYFAP